MLGTQIMLPFGYKNAFLVITIITSVISIALSLILIPSLWQNGTALAWLFAEIFVTVTMFFYLSKKDYN